ncbi:MAG: CBU_0585 family protein [Pseudomonadota bacterium]|nr:CBU_0585 family protein [Pseudomonadota bacterium]
MFHFFKRKLRHYYISPLDKALDTYRQNNPKTRSQQSEIRKHSAVFKNRDASKNE